MTFRELYIKEACVLSSSMFDIGELEDGFVFYDKAIAALHECKEPLAFLASFTYVEWIRTTYIEGPGDAF